MTESTPCSARSRTGYIVQCISCTCKHMYCMTTVKDQLRAWSVCTLPQQAGKQEWGELCSHYSRLQFLAWCSVNRNNLDEFLQWISACLSQRRCCCQGTFPFRFIDTWWCGCLSNVLWETISVLYTRLSAYKTKKKHICGIDLEWIRVGLNEVLRFCAGKQSPTGGWHSYFSGMIKRRKYSFLGLGLSRWRLLISREGGKGMGIKGNERKTLPKSWGLLDRQELLQGACNTWCVFDVRKGVTASFHFSAVPFISWYYTPTAVHTSWTGFTSRGIT